MVTRCPLCDRETMKTRVAHGPPMSAEEVETGVCLHPAHIYDLVLPPCESIGVLRLARLRDALRRYGEHDGDCAASVAGAAGDTRCTCGYDEASA
jgi:hypothetical protein